MKFLIVHNRYKHRGGEESVVEAQKSLLAAAGHSVVSYERDYAQIATWRLGRLRSLFTALYSRRSVRDIRAIVEREKPDMALVHNLYPLISPAVLPVLKRGGVRTVMMLHNFRLVCPTGIFFRDGRICERCGSSPVREWQCVKHRCQGSLAGSLAFALRAAWSRKRGYFDSVDWFCALSEFQVEKLAKYGVEASKLRVLANPLYDLPQSDVERKNFVGMVGRFFMEKGAMLFLEVARLMPEVEFKVAGDVSADVGQVPLNVEFVGKLDRRAMADFYSEAAVVVSCSALYETFGLSIAEAMYYRAAVVVPRLAAMPDLVQNGKAGEIYTAGNAVELAQKIELLLLNSAYRDRLTKAAKIHIDDLCGAQNYCDSLTALK